MRIVSMSGAVGSRRRTPFVKLGVFMTVAALLAVYLAVVLGDISFSGSSGYRAYFTSASGMANGSPVRIAGVDVGKVTSVGIHDGDGAVVGFDLDHPYTVTTATHASIRYKNLIGDRYLELSRDSGPAEPMRAGAAIPESRTSPALDLDTLLDGFKPLFEGLDPAAINAVSTEIVQVFQGESGNVTTLLSSVASLTSTLADRNALIGDVIDNLATALTTVSVHGSDLSTLILQLQQLISGLSAQRNPIGDALVHIQGLTSSVSSLLAIIRPDLAADVTGIRSLATTLNANSDSIVSTLQKLPHAYKLLARLGSYGNFFNFYYCSIAIKYSSAMTYNPPGNKAARCQN